MASRSLRKRGRTPVAWKWPITALSGPVPVLWCTLRRWAPDTQRAVFQSFNTAVHVFALTGYAWSGLGENIAAGYPGIEAVLAGWMGSDGHCANIMNATFNQVGLVCVPGTGSTTYNNYWTMDAAKSP